MITENEFIDDLAEDLPAAPSLLAPPLRSAIWFYISLALVGTFMYLLHPFREGAMEELANPRFLVETILPFLSVVGMASLVFMMSIPGVAVSKAWQALAFVPFVFYGLSVFLGTMEIAALTPSMNGKRETCFIEVLILSWFAVLFMVLLLRRAFVFQKVKTGVFVGLASASIPMAFMQVACMYVPEHILSHHVAPALIVGAVVGCLSPLLFWKSSV